MQRSSMLLMAALCALFMNGSSGTHTSSKSAAFAHPASSIRPIEPKFCGRSEGPGLAPRSTFIVRHAQRRPQDYLISGLSEISFAFSLGVLWSEYFIFLTGCGPPDLSDTLERICYQGLIVFAGSNLFLRIVAGESLEEVASNVYGPLEKSTLIQVRLVEWLHALAVVGAFLALGYQYYARGDSNLDGLSGINVDMCRALQDTM